MEINAQFCWCSIEILTTTSALKLCRLSSDISQYVEEVMRNIIAENSQINSELDNLVRVCATETCCNIRNDHKMESFYKKRGVL